MAIDMISEAPSLATSPRISFSHNLHHKDIAPPPTTANNDFNSDFDFCISNSTDTETSSADELFLHGLIRPLQLQQKFVTSSKLFPLSKTQSLLNSVPPLPLSSSENEISKQEIKSEQQQKNLSNSNSFWGIKRSSSVHCVNTHKKTSFWSLPLLSRSNSTGSVPNSKQSVQKQSSAQWKQMKNSSSSSAAAASFYTSQKPPLRKNYGQNLPRWDLTWSGIIKSDVAFFWDGGTRAKKNRHTTLFSYWENPSTLFRIQETRSTSKQQSS